MQKELSYTIEEVSQLLKVSKLTLYDLVKKGELPVFRVGRQMRIDAVDLEHFIHNHKSSSGISAPSKDPAPSSFKRSTSQIVISGQDLVLDIFGKYIEKKSSYKTLRSHTGSLNSLISMYNGECDIASLHMFDGDTGEYNIPYIKRILVGYSYILINLMSRKAGIYVQKGNPLQIQSCRDLQQKHVRIVNREKGSGARILLDEQLRLNSIPANGIVGYDQEETSHLSVASSIASGKADAGIGSEKAAKLAGIDFVPLISERYDLAILKTSATQPLIQTAKEILDSEEFQTEVASLGDYDTALTGKVMYETQ
ncbi:substrate-binding domain-containing protein [Peribacillus kribbensis]|uniref:substrate-binding domain-containing protein n=1 Tax=Peribacillus kribbensis TaxID=356658 RepID=UPI000402003E|nr:helix-turn-helix transcriptional regulator [Peribacillus kribbensis]